MGGTSDELWDAEINPTDQPRIEAAPIELQEAIRGALDRRTDVSRARRQLDVNEATVDNLRNSTLPALDLVGSYQLTGQGGPRLVPAGTSFEDIFGGAGGMIPGGYRDALHSIAKADYPIWDVQLQMTWPLGRSRLRDFAVRVVNLFRRDRLERELDAELRAYLELDVEENIRRGMAPKEARRTALTRLRGVEMVKEECRDVQRFRVAEDLWRDLRHGFRRLLARPVLAVVAVAVLAVGIGANIAILALVDALLLRPLPGADPSRLVAVLTTDLSSGRQGPNSYPDFLDIRESAGDVFENVTAASFVPDSVGVRIGGEYRVMSAQMVEPNYFDTLGLRPVHGRGFEAVEPAAVAVVSDAVLLQAQFSGAGGVDLVTLAGAAACLALGAAVAIGVPAARALRIDPADALRAAE